MGKKSLRDLRLNNTIEMKNGQLATIIEYRDSRDIDIRFEDGTIIRHKKYSDFEKGEINNIRLVPNFRQGSSRRMNNGEIATIIAYRKYNDIDIQFEDGTIVTNKQYFNFLSGAIKNPNTLGHYNSRPKDFESSCIGERRTMNNGQTAEIIYCRGYYDIDVKFDDGTIVKNKLYAHFKKGSIRNPNYEPKNLAAERIGSSKKMSNGQKATIIAYINCHDINVQFEDGTIVCHRNYKEFKKGNICNPNYIMPDSYVSKKNLRQERLGMTKTMKNGYTAEIILYKNSANISVKFEDGTIVNNVNYYNFINGYVKKR